MNLSFRSTAAAVSRPFSLRLKEFLAVPVLRSKIRTRRSESIVSSYFLLSQIKVATRVLNLPTSTDSTPLILCWTEPLPPEARVFADICKTWSSIEGSTLAFQTLTN